MPGDQHNEETELFNCSICLELVYKPVVQACGHVFCFWCAFQSMNMRKESRCPVCRRPYNFFPRVCELLHFALSKAVPEEYGQRGRDVQCLEERKQMFSPRFLESPKQLWSTSFDEISGSNPSQLTPRGVTTPIIDTCSSLGSALSPQKERCHADSPLAKRNVQSMQKALTVDDFRCSYCKDLLYRPVVLNCGEVFCEPCLKNSSSRIISCPSCKTPHPGKLVLLCLELHQYLESAFPREYCSRKLQHPAEAISASCCERGHGEDCKTEGLIHEGVGCDRCGMFPIEGAGYYCMECTDKSRFHLCGNCREIGGNITGRFNQEHHSNHEMRLMPFRPHRQLTFNVRNSAIQRRRQQQHTVTDLDEYINIFV